MPEPTAFQLAAVLMARGRMYEDLEREFPGAGAQLYVLACAGGLTDALNRPDLARDLAPAIDAALQGTRYRLTERRAN